MTFLHHRQSLPLPLSLELSFVCMFDLYHALALPPVLLIAKPQQAQQARLACQCGSLTSFAGTPWPACCPMHQTCSTLLSVFRTVMTKEAQHLVTSTFRVRSSDKGAARPSALRGLTPARSDPTTHLALTLRAHKHLE